MIKGERLKQLRTDRGITQLELGKILGVTKASVCCYEKETRTPTIETILALTQYFGVSSDYLIGSDMFVTVKNNKKRTYIMSKEEMSFIEELRKDKYISAVLLDDPIRGMELLKKKIG